MGHRCLCFCAWYFDDLRYDSLILCFDGSTHLQRSWSIEAVHCVKVRDVMVVVPVVLLASNMIFIPAVKKNSSCSTQHVFILLKLHRTPPCTSGSQWQISMAKIPFKLPFRIFGKKFFWKNGLTKTWAKVKPWGCRYLIGKAKMLNNLVSYKNHRVVILCWSFLKDHG